MEKPGRTQDERALQYIQEQVQQIEPKLKELFEKDARDFAEVVRLRIERDQAEDRNKKAAFSRQTNELLETATENTLQIVEQCMKLIDHSVVVFDAGWHAVRGDSGAAISAAIAGVMSGIFITNLNLKTLKGRKYASDRIAKCRELYHELERKQLNAVQRVTSLNAEAIEALQLELPST